MSVLRKTREHYKGLDWEEELKKQKELRRGIDDRMIAKIQQFRTDRLDKLMILITKSGNGGMIWLSGLRHLLNLKLPTSRRNAVFFCQILPFYLLYGVVFYLGLCYNRV